MSNEFIFRWPSGSNALGFRALLYLMEDPSQATTSKAIAHRLGAEAASVEACLDGLVACGVATASEGECGGPFYRLASAPSLHALAARVRRNTQDYEGLSPALRPLLRRYAQRATGMQGARPTAR